jgi:hypothetical protein
MPKHNNPAASHITHDDLLLIAAESARDNHLSASRSFVARLIGHLPEEVGNQIAVALDLPHMVSTALEAQS